MTERSPREWHCGRPDALGILPSRHMIEIEILEIPQKIFGKMNAQITEMAKRFMVETYGPCPRRPDDRPDDTWCERYGLVLLALDFAETERNAVCPKCGNYLAGHATGAADICTCYLPA